MQIPGFMKNAFLASTVGVSTLVSPSPLVADEPPSINYDKQVKQPAAGVGLLERACVGIPLTAMGGLAFVYLVDLSRRQKEWKI